MSLQEELLDAKMTLQELLDALKTDDVKVILLNTDGNEIIKFFSHSSNNNKGVESEFLEKTVAEFKLVADRPFDDLVITLKDDEPEPEPDPEPDPEP